MKHTRLLLTTAAALGLSSCTAARLDSGTHHFEWTGPAPEHLSWWIAGGGVLAGLIGWSRGAYWKGRSREQAERIIIQRAALDEPVNDVDLQDHIKSLKEVINRERAEHLGALQGLRETREGQIAWLREQITETGSDERDWLRARLEKLPAEKLSTGDEPWAGATGRASAGWITNPATGGVKCPCGCGREFNHNDGRPSADWRETLKAELIAEFEARLPKDEAASWAKQDRTVKEALDQVYGSSVDVADVVKDHVAACAASSPAPCSSSVEAVEDALRSQKLTSAALDPGEGWRLLTDEDIIREGDEYFDSRDLIWRKSSNIGRKHNGGYRRRVAAPVASPERLPDSIWDGAPAWANWLAMDRFKENDPCQMWYWYEKHPEICRDSDVMWGRSDEASDYAGAPDIDDYGWEGDWKDSLHKRPAAKG